MNETALELTQPRVSMDREKLALIGRTLAPDLTAEELALFGVVCERHQLDPFAGQIHAVKRYSNVKDPQTSAWSKVGRVTFQTSQEGYLSIAERTNEYDGCDEPVYGPPCTCGEVKAKGEYDEATRTRGPERVIAHPEWATVKVYRRGRAHPTGATAYWHEYYPGTSMWHKMPRVMLAKVARVAALRLAFPYVMAGLYSDDEMEAPAGNPTPVMGEIQPAKASLETQKAFEAALGEPTATQAPALGPQGTVAAQTVTGPVAAPQNGKRRGRPLGSKNKAAEAKQNAAAEEERQAHELRAELVGRASRLLKYQYLEKARDLPPMEQWMKEVEKTLGTFIERKYGAGVLLTDLELQTLDEAIYVLNGYIAKYEAPEDDIEHADQGHRQDSLETPQPTEESSPSGGESGDSEGFIEPAGYVLRVRPEAESAGSPPGLLTAPLGGLDVPAVPQSPAQDSTVVSLHKPIARNPVTAQRRGEGMAAIDPQAALARARALADLRNRTTALLATREGLIQLSAKDEDRLRIQADSVMENVSKNAFQKAIKDLDVQQLDLLVERAKAAAKP